jgi:uncharacterized protein with PIN domain
MRCKICSEPSPWEVCDRCARELSEERARQRIEKRIAELEEELARAEDTERKAWIEHDIQELEKGLD